MSGIYIHIPFCKQKCSYCDFHFSTDKRAELEMVSAITKEIIHKKKRFPTFSVNTIYFGGGSPSFIQTDFLNKIIDTLYEHFEVADNAEVTIECNPDDLDLNFVQEIKKMGFNRISLGVQSFFEEDLKMLNRAHDSNQIENAIRLLKENDLSNITIDLIYGLPGSNRERWQSNLDKALSLDIPHISSYCLTIEDKTLLKHQIENGVYELPSEEDQLVQFDLLVSTLTENGFNHYEISNFAKAGHESRHNSSYWENKDYLGLGPSAHSKVGNRRFWNISNNHQFIKRFKTDKEYWEEEVLSDKDIFNELIMIGLRTKRGVSLQDLKVYPFYQSQFLPELERLIQKGKIQQENERIFITGKDKFVADTIISDLFIV